ncbi:hypothetical protein Ndes2437B_g08557 [Nannochloris sp. 'desiccata']
MIIEHLNGTPKVSLLLLGPKNSGKSALLKSIIEKEKSRNIPPGQKKPAIVIDERFFWSRGWNHRALRRIPRAGKKVWLKYC